MPIHIEEVESEVSVESQGASQSAAPARALPSAEEMQRWLQLARRQAWDESRTQSVDRDD
jgi:hypothetical protein